MCVVCDYIYPELRLNSNIMYADNFLSGHNIKYPYLELGMGQTIMSILELT